MPADVIKRFLTYKLFQVIQIRIVTIFKEYFEKFFIKTRKMRLNWLIRVQTVLQRAPNGIVKDLYGSFFFIFDFACDLPKMLFGYDLVYEIFFSDKKIREKWAGMPEIGK